MTEMNTEHGKESAEPINEGTGGNLDRRQLLRRVGLSSALTLAGTGNTAVAENNMSGRSRSVRDEGIVWPPSQELPRFSKPKHLDVVDLRSVSVDHLLYHSLQGVINRRRPRLYILLDFEEGPYTWLDELDIKYTVHDDPDAIETVLDQYISEIETVIAYDPEIPDTVNVATTIAGVEDGVVAAPDRATDLVEKYDHLDLHDLRGEFEDGQDAYTWQFDTLWEETSDRHVVGLPPGDYEPVVDIPQERQDYYEALLTEDQRVRDTSNRDLYEIDLSPFLGDGAVYLRFDDAFSDGGWGPGLHEIRIEADGTTIAEFEPATPDEEPFLYDPNGSQTQDGFRFADGDAYFIYRFEPPVDTSELTAYVDVENQFDIAATTTQPPDPSETEFESFPTHRDYAVATRAFTFRPETSGDELFDSILESVETNGSYLGWFTGDFAGEADGVERCSQHSVYVAPTDYFENMTVFSGVNDSVDHDGTVESPDLENKIYITLTYTEGDNLQYNQKRMRWLWDRDARGEVPINWSTAPLLIDAAPKILSYYQQTATENDHLMCGPSGVGYMYPRPWPEETLHEFTDQTARYMEKSGLETMYLLNRLDHENLPLNDHEIERYSSDIDTSGVTINFGGGMEAETHLHDEGFVEAPGPLVSNPDQLVDEVEANTPNDWDGTEPHFISIGVLAWDMTPGEIGEAVNALKSDYKVVRADQFFELARQALE